MHVICWLQGIPVPVMDSQCTLQIIWNIYNMFAFVCLKIMIILRNVFYEQIHVNTQASKIRFLRYKNKNILFPNILHLNIIYNNIPHQKSSCYLRKVCKKGTSVSEVRYSRYQYNVMIWWCICTTHYWRYRMVVVTTISISYCWYSIIFRFFFLWRKKSNNKTIFLKLHFLSLLT